MAHDRSDLLESNGVESAMSVALSHQHLIQCENQKREGMAVTVRTADLTTKSFPIGPFAGESGKGEGLCIEPRGPRGQLVHRGQRRFHHVLLLFQREPV